MPKFKMSEKLRNEKFNWQKRGASIGEKVADSRITCFMAIYGRRRVGKTFFVKSVFQERFAFFARVYLIDQPVGS